MILGEHCEAGAQLCKTLHKGGFTIYNVIQISSFFEYQVDDTKCKTVFKNSISTSMETQVWKHKVMETQAAFFL